MSQPEATTVCSNYDYNFNVVLVGEKGVGKTSLIDRLVFNSFNPNLQTTLGVAVQEYIIRVNRQRIRVHIWDTPGHESTRDFPPNYFRTADAVIIVFDHSNRQTFLNLDEWHALVLRSVGYSVLVFIVGTKCDVQNPQVDTREVSEFVERNRIPTFQTSSLTGRGVDQMIDSVVDSLLSSTRRHRGFRLDDTNANRTWNRRFFRMCCDGRRSPSPPQPVLPVLRRGSVAGESEGEMRGLTFLGENPLARALPIVEEERRVVVPHEDLHDAIANIISRIRELEDYNPTSFSLAREVIPEENSEQSTPSTSGDENSQRVDPIASSMEPASAAPSTSNTAGDSGASDPAPSRSTAEGDWQSISAESRMVVSFPDSRTESSRPLSSSDPDAAVAARSSNDRVAPYVSIMTPD